MKRHNLVAVSGIAFIFIVAWIYQTFFLLNWDVSWDLLATKRLVAGGTYTHDFFDLNPPLILFLYIPAVFLAKISSISQVLALRIYLFALGIVSLSMCYRLIRSIFLKKHVYLAYAFLFALAILFFLFPGNSFGEREHLLIIFMLPYFLAVVYRLQSNTLDSSSAIGIGLFSALGFALKPYFLVPMVLVEMYTIFFTRNAWAWLRAEVITIMVFLVVYVAFIVVFYPDYLVTVVPIGMRYYYASFKTPWYSLCYNALMGFCCMAIVFYWVLYKKNPYPVLSSVLLLALIGFMGSYVIQQTSWSYHMLPAVSMALLMITLFFGIFVTQHPKYTFIHPLLATLLFIIPWRDIGYQYTSGVKFKKTQQPLITFLHTHARHQPVYFISASVSSTFPAVDIADSIYASRLLHLFWLPGLVKNSTPNYQSLLPPERSHDEQFLINLITEDIEMKKPKLVLVDVREHKPYYSLLSFEYLPYLLKNRHFQAVWQPYHYVTTIEAPEPTLLDEIDMSLYLAQSIQQINLKQINGDAVILMGGGTDKIAYYVHNHQFVKNNTSLVHTRVQLTKQELLRLPKHDGKVNISRENENLISHLINRAVSIHAYKYQIYQREDPIPTGIS